MNVLIPTDFSDNSWNAIAYAVHLLTNVEVTFHILHVSSYIDAEVGLQANGIVLNKNLNENTSQQELNTLQKRIANSYNNAKHNFTYAIEHNSFIKVLRNQVISKEIDLIIMGTKGASGIKKYTLGSNAGDVITKVKCSVLVIPEKARYEIPKQIAFPTDFNLHYKERVLKTLKSITQLHQSFLQIVHVGIKSLPLTHEQETNKAFLSHSIEDIPHEFNDCNCLSIEDSIQNFVEKKHIHIIAMVAKNLNFFQRILFRPKVEKMTYQTEIPFLVLHE